MERLWFKIGETATRIGVKPKDLRYWEQVIPEIRPRRSHGNLRYYHRDEIPRLERIRAWLSEGLTVGDCRQLLRTGQLTRGLDFGLEEEPEALAELPLPARSPRKATPTPPSSKWAMVLESLRSLRDRLAQAPGVAAPAKAKLDAPPKGR